jgi:hypothetical protein
MEVLFSTSGRVLATADPLHGPQRCELLLHRWHLRRHCVRDGISMIEYLRCCYHRHASARGHQQRPCHASIHDASKGSPRSLCHQPLTGMCRRAGLCVTRSMAPTMPAPIADLHCLFDASNLEFFYQIYCLFDFLNFFELVNNLCPIVQGPKIYMSYYILYSPRSKISIGDLL